MSEMDIHDAITHHQAQFRLHLERVRDSLNGTATVYGYAEAVAAAAQHAAILNALRAML